MLASRRSFGGMSGEGKVEAGEANLLRFLKSFMEKLLKERNLIQS